MYSNDHAAPHFHARWGEYEAKITIGFNGFDLDPDVLHGDYGAVERSAAQASR
jgi:hypothetical protein